MSKIVIGAQPSGKNLRLDLDLLIPSRLLIQANSGGGKSYLLRRLAEQIYGKVQTIIIDPEGEFFTLREKFGYVLVGEGGETPCDVRSAAMLAERFLELKASAICDLYEAFRSRPMERRRWVSLFLNALIDAPRNLWHPLIVIVDEAHKFCPQESPKAAKKEDREIISDCKDAMVALATTGRKRGFCALWATQRLAKLDKDASAEFFNRLVGMTIEDVDVDRAADLMSVAKADRKQFVQSLRTLTPGQFYAFGRAIATERTLVKTGEISTRHPESGKQDASSSAPPMPAEVKKFLPQLSDLPKEAEQKALTEAEYKREIRDLRTKLTAVQRQQPAPAATSAKPDPSQRKTIQQLRSMLEDVMRVLGKAKMSEVRDVLPKAEEIEAVLQRAAADISRLIGSKRAIQQRELDSLRGEIDRVMARAKSLLSLPDPLPNSHPSSSRASTPPAAPTPPRARFDDVEDLDAPQSDRSQHSGVRSVLLAIAQLNPADRVQISTVTGHKRATRNRYIQHLQKAGLVEENQDGKFVPTSAGMVELGTDYEPLPTGSALQRYWLQRLHKGEREIFEFVLRAGGEEVDRDSVSDATGYLRATRNRYIQRLQARHLLNPGTGPVVPAAMLFDRTNGAAA